MSMPPASALSGAITSYGESMESGFEGFRDIISNGRYVLGLTVLLFVLGGLLYLWGATPIYKSDALIQVEQKQDSIKAALGDAMPWFGGQVPITGEIEIIRSRMVVEKVVDALGFEIGISPVYFPLFGRAMARSWRGPDLAPPFLGLSTFAWGGEILRISTLELPKPLLDEPLQLIVTAEGFELHSQDGDLLLKGLVGERISVEAGLRGSEPFSIFVTELVARPGTRFNVIRYHRSEVVARLQKAVRVSEKGRQSGVLGVTYEGSEPQQVARVVYELVTAYQKQNVERKSAEAAQTLTFLESKQLPELRVKLAATEADLNQYRLQRGSADLTKETELILQQSVGLEKTHMELLQKREELRQRFTGNHPALVGLEAQLRQIEKSQGEVSIQVKKLPNTQQELLRLTRDVEVNNALYTALLNSAQELQVVKAGTVGNVRIIDFPEAATKRSRPQAGLTLLLALFLGFLFGVIVAFVLQSLRNGVYDPGVVERQLGLANYAVVPFSRAERKLWLKDSEKSAHLLAASTPDDIAVEALRSLRTALHFALMDAKNNIVLLTGPAPGVGKSFITINLGAVLAAGGKKIVVVDADLRRGHLQKYVNCERSPGLSDYIAGRCEFAAAIHKTAIAGLEFVPSGTPPPNPAELLLNPRFSDFLKQLGSRFDYVLIDTPPVLAVTDASIVGALAGCTLLVLKAGVHPLRAIEESVRRLRQAGVELKGTVFNQAKLDSGRYGYGYGYTYNSESTPE